MCKEKNNQKNQRVKRNSIYTPIKNEYLTSAKPRFSGENANEMRKQFIQQRRPEPAREL
jgi:hypothetical protein